MFHDAIRSQPNTRRERPFPPVAKSAAQARKFVLETEELAEDPLKARLETVVSEVVTNVILHARTDFVVAVLSDDRHIRVEVSDLSKQLPKKRPFDEQAVTGRGLHIVDAMTDRWGVMPEDSGKTVWFELKRERLSA